MSGLTAAAWQVCAIAHAAAVPLAQLRPPAPAVRAPPEVSYPTNGIEHVVVRRVEPSALVLVITKAREIELIDLGRPPAENPVLRVAAGPGTRFAEDAYGGTVQSASYDGSFYCFDRYTVTALTAPGIGDARVAWQRGQWPSGVAPGDVPAAGEAEFQGDPELLASIVAAAAVPAGVIVARSDGLVALADAENGSIVWKTKLDGLAVVDVSIVDQWAVLLWKAGDEVRALWVDGCGSAGQPEPRAVGERWPIWWEATTGGLIAVWPDEAVFLRQDGERHIVAARPTLTRFSAALVDDFQPHVAQARGTALAARPGEALLIAADETGAVAAFAATDGRLVWHVRSTTLLPPILDFSPASLRVAEDYAIAVDGASIAIYSCIGGGFEFGEVGPGAILSATIAGDDLRYVYELHTAIGHRPGIGLLSERVMRSVARAVNSRSWGQLADCELSRSEEPVRGLWWTGSGWLMSTDWELRSWRRDAERLDD